MSGDIYRSFILASNDFNRGLPIYINENSIAYKQPKGGKAEPRPDGWNREKYLKSYIGELVKCVEECVPIKQYLYWSIVDDYEWNSYDPRLDL